MDFAVHAAKLSAEADNRLGDSILYGIGAAVGGDLVPMKGRIFASESASGFGSIDEPAGGWRLRIAKDKVARPSLSDRLQCDAILGEGTTWRPAGKDPIDDGRYWLVDLQKV